MTLLKQETVFNVIEAAIEAGLECETLVLSIPREAQASLRVSGHSARERYLSVVSQLNDWGASDRKGPPLRILVHNMQFLARARTQASVFQRALAEIDGATPSVNEQGHLLFMRTKDCYVVRGYRVIPPVEAPVSITFQAWRGAGAVSIVGVTAVATLDVVIEKVKEQIAQLEGRERVEGSVVLFSSDPADAERVSNAGLTPVPYRELAPMGIREVTALVDRQQAELARAQAESGAATSDEEEQLTRELRAALRESLVRIVTISTADLTGTARRAVLSLTSDYLRDPARAAPLLLPLPNRTATFQALVASAFGERKVPFSRFDFPGLLAENAFRPVFVLNSQLDEADAGPAREVLEAGGKIIVVMSADMTVSPQQVARRWKVPARNVRNLSVASARTEGGRREQSNYGRKGITRDAVPRFEHGRALLVGVANYAHVAKLPACVLSDARDLAALLKAPHRCGYREDNVELLLDAQATAERMRLALQRLAKESRRGDTVVVYFSGHGLRKTEGEREAYLLPIDYDPQDLSRTALSATELTNLLAAIPASRLVVLLDACHAAGAGHVKTTATATFKSGLDDETYEVLGRGVGRVVIASSRADEVSWALQGMNNSLFTTYLLDALGGAAAKPDEDVVRVLDVFHHVSKHVPLRIETQHPILKAHDVENNFPIALFPKGKQGASRQAGEARGVPLQSGFDATPPLPAKARLSIKRRLVTRWDDLADYFEIPLADRAKFDRGYEGQRTLDWLEERGRLSQLRQAFVELHWHDLIEELDRHAH